MSYLDYEPIGNKARHFKHRLTGEIITYWAYQKLRNPLFRDVRNGVNVGTNKSFPPCGAANILAIWK